MIIDDELMGLAAQALHEAYVQELQQLVNKYAYAGADVERMVEGASVALWF
jgi:hypothetical protein